ncbi:MAG: hypothetical protein ACQESE_01160 [Nanobdellota archaeon]
MIDILIQQIIDTVRLGKKGMEFQMILYLILALVGFVVLLSIILHVTQDKGGEALSATDSLLKSITGKD